MGKKVLVNELKYINWKIRGENYRFERRCNFVREKIGVEWI